MVSGKNYDDKMTGSFDGMMLDGEKHISEDIEVKDLHIAGKIFFHEDVDADTVEIGGEAEFAQSFSCDRLSIGGVCLARNGINCDEAVISGNMTVYGKLSAEKVAVTGMIDVMKKSNLWEMNISGRAFLHDSVRFENAYITGLLNVNDKAKGNKINIASAMTSRIQCLIADTVSVEHDGSSEDIEGVFLLESDTVDCDYADIQCCKIDRLYCANAKIGEYCDINELYYTDETEISEKAKVRKIVKI